MCVCVCVCLRVCEYMPGSKSKLPQLDLKTIYILIQLLRRKIFMQFIFMQFILCMINRTGDIFKKERSSKKV